MIAQSTNLLRRFTLLAIASVLLMLCAFAKVAHAATLWGELGHASLPAGVEEVGKINLALTTSFAVDSTDGSYYVAHELKPGVRPTFEIQRFNAQGVAEASVSLTPPEAKKTSTGAAGEEVQLAVDPKRGRVFALIVYRRRSEQNVKEEKEEKEEEEKTGKAYTRAPLDSEELAAGELYAFDYTGGKLVPTKTLEENGEKLPAPFITEGTFKAQGEAPKEALLNPKGMAVEPATGDITITGDQDEQENVKVEKGEGKPECRSMAQLITVQENKTTGELNGALGNRYVDNHEVLQELACEKERDEYVPFSPIISPGGKLFAEEARPICPGIEECHGGEIWELPKSSEQIGETAKIKEFATAPRVLYTLIEPQQLLVFKPEGVVGPTMSFVSDGEGSNEGNIYISAEVENNPTLKEPADGAVLELGYSEAGAQPEAKELGWTGGGHEAGGAQEGCVIPRPSSQAFYVGGFNEGGGKEGVVAFDAFEHEKKSVIDALLFGPGGSTTGCPHVTVTPPSVKVKGVAVTKLVPGEVATFESTIEAANAASVEWKFENTVTHKVETESGGYEFQTPKLEHSFAEEGKYKITEVIQPDNLASPTIEVTPEHNLELIVKLAHPTFEISAAQSFGKGEEAKFEANILDENKKTIPYKYVWKFGDGIEEKGETESNIVVGKHVYSSLCASCTVTLEITDKEGATSASTATIQVHISRAEQEAVEAAETAGRKAEEEAAVASAARKHQEEEAAAAAARKHQEEEAAAAAKKHQEELEKAKSSKPLTRTELLAKALKLCKKEPKKKRTKCEAAAHKKYASKKSSKKHRRK